MGSIYHKIQEKNGHRWGPVAVLASGRGVKRPVRRLCWNFAHLRGRGINPATFQRDHLGLEIWSKQALKMAELWFFAFGGIWGVSR
jgi:hypothetical protein